jgi:hypothetical protein
VYDIIDAFTPEVGVGPIPLKKKTLKNCIYWISSSSSPFTLIPTHINPAAFTYVGFKRCLLAAIYNPIKIDEIKQKLEEDIEVMKKLGRNSQYREGFGKLSRGCYKVEKKLKK